MCRERESERETDRQTDRERKLQNDKCSYIEIGIKNTFPVSSLFKSISDRYRTDNIDLSILIAGLQPIAQF